MNAAPRTPQSLCLDQRVRWRRGEAVRVESYLEQHPSLRTDRFRTRTSRATRR